MSFRKEKKIKKSNRLLRIIFITLGTLFTGLGLIGILVPILPTTPFLLLAAALYAKSSDRFYIWLIKNKLFGKYIKNYRDGKGIQVRVKVFIILTLWTTIILSIVYATEITIIRIILAIIASGVTVHILLIKKSV